MPSQWFISHDGRELGPFLPSQFKKLAEMGQLLPTDIVWRDDNPKRIPASKIKGLFQHTPEHSNKIANPPPHPSQQDRPAADDDAVKATISSSRWIVGLMILLSLTIGIILMTSHMRATPRSSEKLESRTELNHSVNVGDSDSESLPVEQPTSQAAPTPSVHTNPNKSDFSKVDYTPVDFSTLDYSKGPNSETLEFFYDGNSTLCGYIEGNPPTADDTAWRGLRQDALRKAHANKSFVFHGIQTTWSKKPKFPIESAEKRAKKSGKQPPIYDTTGGVPYKTWYLWNGKKHGPEKVFDPTGKLSSEAVYLHGVAHGPNRLYWPNGQKELEQFWYEGKLHGQYTKWHENGTISETSVFVDGKQEGVWTTFFSNGKKQKEALFADGKVVGKVREWDEKGKDVSVDLSGTLATGNGYTERILSIHPNVRRKFHAFNLIKPEKHDPRYKPGTVADLLQAMSLLAPGGRLAGLPVDPNIYGKYWAVLGDPLIPTVLWKQVFLLPKESPVQEKFADTMWTFSCADGEVRIFGFSDNSNHGVRVSTVFWNTYYREFDGFRP